MIVIILMGGLKVGTISTGVSLRMYVHFQLGSLLYPPTSNTHCLEMKKKKKKLLAKIWMEFC